MAIRDDFVLAFNRGVLSPLARYRADVKRAGMSAQKQMNFIPRTMGPMSLRPGLRFVGATATATGHIKHIPFIFSNTDTALIEITDQLLRVRVDEQYVTRPGVTSTITNPNFDTDLTGWTDADQGSSVSVWATGGYMSLTGTGDDGAIRYQQVTVGGADADVEHSLRISVLYGTVGLRIGSALDTDDYVTETYLGKGEHSIGFTPSSNFYILFFNRSTSPALVNSCDIEAAGIMGFTTALLPSDTLDEIRYAQSGDIIFIARGITRAPSKVERRGNRSWSLVDYLSDNGPFLPDNLTNITITPSGLSGQINLVASQKIFKTTNQGWLYSLTTTGQTVSNTLGALDDVTDYIKVTGILEDRRFFIALKNTWVGTVQLQRSLVEPDSWVDVAGQSWTGNVETSYLDGLDNQVVYYRLKMTAYTSGSATGDLHIPTGSITGIVRIVSYTDEQNVGAIVLKTLGGTDPTSDWAEGAWSDRRGFPSAVGFFQGRLYWAGKDKIWGTVVDDFYNFDRFYVGDAGPIERSIGTGPVDSINWLMPLRVLAMGAQGSEYTCRSTGFEEPITPTNFNLREESTFGSAAIECVKIDNNVVFVDRTGSRVIQGTATVDAITTEELSILIPEIFLPNVKRISMQRRPDTRVHFLRCDGTVVLLVYDKAEQVNCFITVETAGLVEDIVVLPGVPEDKVYYSVARVVDGVVVRYLECWALTSEAEGGTDNKMADAFVHYDGVATDTITGLSHLEGKSIIAWGNSKDLGTYTVASGSVTLSESVTCATVGLPYYAEFQSGKLEFLTVGAPTLKTKSRSYEMGLILENTHKQGLQYGTDFDHLDNLPLVEEEAAVGADYLWTVYEQDPLLVNGIFNNDTRLCLRADAPRPCTVVAAVIGIDNDE